MSHPPLQTSSTTTNNFTAAKVYSVFAQDGSKKDYTVTVSIALSPLKDMTAFGFSTPNVSGTINGANIKVKVPFGTNLTNLKAVFTHSGASVNIAGVNQMELLKITLSQLLLHRSLHRLASSLRV